MRRVRFQNRVVGGRLALPVAVLLALLCWLAAFWLQPDAGEGAGEVRRVLPEWGLPLLLDRLCCLLLGGLIGYFLIGLNNTFNIIRIRASAQTSVFFLLFSACPVLHVSCLPMLVNVLLLVALFFLFKSYRQERSERNLFHSSLALGLIGLFCPQLVFLVPLSWIGAYSLRSLHVRSLAASLIGWSVPYWCMFGYACYRGELALFRNPFDGLSVFLSWRSWRLLPEYYATVAYLLLLFLVASFHCLLTGYEEKMRTRSYLHLLIVFCLFLFACIGLQPDMVYWLLPMLMAIVGILGGRLFVLSATRASNLFFIGMLAGWLLLWGYNLWIQL